MDINVNKIRAIGYTDDEVIYDVGDGVFMYASYDGNISVESDWIRLMKYKPVTLHERVPATSLKRVEQAIKNLDDDTFKKMKDIIRAKLDENPELMDSIKKAQERVFNIAVKERKPVI